MEEQKNANRETPIMGGGKKGQEIYVNTQLNWRKIRGGWRAAALRKRMERTMQERTEGLKLRLRGMGQSL